MAKVPKQRRIKRATVLVKRRRCIRNTKVKSHSPSYQQLLVNNHSLARALSQEKEENELLFSRNVELIAQVQDLIHACNTRDRVISNIIKNSKEVIQLLVTISGYETNTMASCQEFVSNQANSHRASTNSTGRRESTKRMSTKSPARGVVKPMVSGYTITKPTINLSRVNMQRLQNPNLSIIEEGPSTPDRNLERSSENRHSRTRNALPERIPVTTIRDEGSDDDERIIERINRRTGRFSQGRLSSGRYSKRNSGRLSGGGGIAGRLSKRNSDHSELIKSPRVTLQDVSRYLTNNQTINVRLLPESTNVNQTNSATTADDTQMNGSLFNPEFPIERTVIPESQEMPETTTNSSSDSEDIENNTVRSRKPNLTVNNSSKLDKRKSSRKKCLSSRTLQSQMVDGMEGTSWMYDSETMETDDTLHNSAVSAMNDEDEHGDNVEVHSEEEEQGSSPISSLSTEQRHRSSGYFRVPDLPKSFGKVTNSRLNSYDNYGSSNANASTSNPVNATCSFINQDNEEDDEEDDGDDDAGEQRINALRFITQRRGISGRMPSSSHNASNDPRNNLFIEDDDDDETLILNIQRQLKPRQSTSQQPPEQPELLQFDMNELLQLTPLKPLLNINSKTNNGPAVQADIEPEPTATIQITQNFPRVGENINAFSQMSTVKINQPNGVSDLPAVSTSRGHEAAADGQIRRFSDLSTTRLSSRVELPRITDFMNITEENHQESQLISSPENNKQQEKRKRLVTKTDKEVVMQKERPVLKKNKPRKPNKKSNNDKDPSSAKVVLQKLNETSANSSLSNDKRNHLEESNSSTRSSMVSRADISSDSESSSTNFNSRQISSRPRRQKAPRNLKEQGLLKKLRRNN